MKHRLTPILAYWGARLARAVVAALSGSVCGAICFEVFGIMTVVWGTESRPGLFLFPPIAILGMVMALFIYMTFLGPCVLAFELVAGSFRPVRDWIWLFLAVSIAVCVATSLTLLGKLGEAGGAGPRSTALLLLLPGVMAAFVWWLQLPIRYKANDDMEESQHAL